MAKRSVFLIVAFTFILCAMISGRADAFGHCARCSTGCYGYAGYYGGAGNCGLGWGNCGAAWWFGYGVYGVPKAGGYGNPYGCGCCAARCHHPLAKVAGWVFHKHGCGARRGCGAGCGSGWSDGGCSSCGDGGGTTGGCQSGNCGTSASIDLPEGATVISDQTTPAPAPQAAPEGAPAEHSASVQQSNFRLASAVRRDGSAAFDKGVADFRQGRKREALTDFEVAASAEPDNALYHYYRALAQYDVDGAEAAQGALQQAVEAETREPIKNWGKRMERVQGRSRLWIESARRSAGLVH